MKRSKVIRAAFVVTVAAAGCATETLIVNPPPPDGGGSAMCPSAPPSSGSACALPEGTMCGWDGMPCPPWGSSGTFARCEGGRWNVGTVSCNPPPPSPDGGADVTAAADVADVTAAADVADAPDVRDAGGTMDAAAPLCPAMPPMIGSACTGSPPGRCGYSFECPGNFPGTSIFECASGRWILQGTAKCNPPPVDVPGAG